MFQAVAYYQYVHLEDPEAWAKTHLALCKKLGVVGRILVAHEGVNGQLSGTLAQCETYIAHLREDPRFANTQFKVDNCDKLAFSRIHVRAKREIVHSGIMEGEIDPLKKTGIHLSPAQFKAMKDEEDVVLLDVRSDYETRVGKFKGALTVDINNFRDFPEKAQELAPSLKGKKVITYCTGGIKCEKASAYLLKLGLEEVYQLQGGILGYSYDQDGEDFQGRLYVFDERITIDVNKVNPSTISTCVRCGALEARSVNCANLMCNDQFVLCETCGWTYSGTCSERCAMAPEYHLRIYTGTGYYGKGPVNS